MYLIPTYSGSTFVAYTKALHTILRVGQRSRNKSAHTGRAWERGYHTTKNCTHATYHVLQWLYTASLSAVMIGSAAHIQHISFPAFSYDRQCSHTHDVCQDYDTHIRTPNIIIQGDNIHVRTLYRHVRSISATERGSEYITS